VTPHVGVVGAGIGGPTLAHALRAHGITVTVFDRDPSPAAAAGYRLHLNPEAITALGRGVPDTVLDDLRATGAGTESFSRFSVLDHRGRTRLRLPVPTDAELLMIGRRPLRSLLTRDLTDVIRWDSAVTGFTEHPDRVTVHVAGERTPIDVDVLVGADGTRSLVTPRVTGRPAARPAGITAIAGTVPLYETTSPPVPADLRHGLGFAIGPRGVGLFLAMHVPRPTTPTRGAQPERPYLVWSVAARPEQFSADPAALTAAGLLHEARRLLHGWAPRYDRLLNASPPGSVAAFPFWFPASLGPWRSDRVTLIGDAIHPMPPTAGAGASTAIIDAVHLADDLANHAVPEALRVYQHRMLGYAPNAVREAEPALTWQRRLANPLLRALATGIVLPAVDTALGVGQALRRRRRSG
jgi:2-polyprenyl-6-methoxyphenol hydroxylase-like FAD-dependent oxidoreductase